MIRSKILVRGAAVAVLALVPAGCGLSLQQMPKPGGLDESTYPVTARFTDVLNLPANAQVREGARVVGEVGDMTLDGYEASVRLNIIDGVELPQGTTVQVRFDNPLGDQYVEIKRPESGGGAPLEAGDVIELADTAAAPTVEDTLGAFATVLTGGGVGDVATITHELNQAFDGNEDDVRDLLKNLETSAELLGDGIGPITDALDQVALLTERLDEGKGTLTDGIATIGPAIQVLAEQNDDLTTLINGLDEFGQAGSRIVKESGEETVDTLQRLVPVVREIVANRNRLTPVLENVLTLVDQVPEVTKFGYARASVTLRVAFDSSPSTATSSPTGAAAGRDESAATRSAQVPAEAAIGTGRAVAERPTVSALMTVLGPLRTAGGER